MYTQEDAIKAIKERADFNHSGMIGTNDPFAWDTGVTFGRSDEYAKRYVELMETSEMVYAVYSGTRVVLWVLRDGTVELLVKRRLDNTTNEKALLEAFTDRPSVEWQRDGATYQAEYPTPEQRNARLMELIRDDGITTIRLS